jgi:hypothetical protein
MAKAAMDKAAPGVLDGTLAAAESFIGVQMLGNITDLLKSHLRLGKLAGEIKGLGASMVPPQASPLTTLASRLTALDETVSLLIRVANPKAVVASGIKAAGTAINPLFDEATGKILSSVIEDFNKIALKLPQPADPTPTPKPA